MLRQLAKRMVPNAVIRRRIGRKAANSILLTFDDGPHRDLTPQILDILAEYDALALFFVVGEHVLQHPEIARAIVKKGHLLGNHTYDHPNTDMPSLGDYRADIARCQHIIRNTTGVEPKFFRSARGVIKLRGLVAARLAGLRSLFWASEGGEWGMNRDKDRTEIIESLLTTIEPGDIVLLHDDHPEMPQILGSILPELIARGFDMRNGIRLL